VEKKKNQPQRHGTLRVQAITEKNLLGEKRRINHGETAPAGAGEHGEDVIVGEIEGLTQMKNVFII